LLEIFNLQEWMFMLNVRLAIRAEVEVRANRTFIPNSNNSSLSTSITINSLVNNWTLNLFLFLNFFFFFVFLLHKGILWNDRLGIFIFSERSWGDSWSFLNFLWNLTLDFANDFR
jgi:hypothetical protein